MSQILNESTHEFNKITSRTIYELWKWTLHSFTITLLGANLVRSKDRTSRQKNTCSKLAVKTIEHYFVSKAFLLPSN